MRFRTDLRPRDAVGEGDLRINYSHFKSLTTCYKLSAYFLDACNCSTLKAVQWMQTQEGQGYGGILAHEIGFGKTRIVGSFLIRGSCESGSTLVLCPVSVLDHCVSEFSAAKLAFKELTADSVQGVTSRLLGIYLCTLSFALSLFKKVSALMTRIWRRLILDEVHKVKPGAA